MSDKVGVILVILD